MTTQPAGFIPVRGLQSRGSSSQPGTGTGVNIEATFENRGSHHAQRLRAGGGRG